MYPAVLKLEGKLVTIVGGGKVALRKARTLCESGARVRVISKEVLESFTEIRLTCEIRDYSEVDLKESFLVIAATNDQVVNARIGNYCNEHQILCNVVDNPQLSSFTTPVSMQRGNLQISISTGGNSPSLAKRIKEDLEERYNEDYIAYLEVLGKVRQEVLKREKDETVRRKILNQLVTLSLEELNAYAKGYFTR